MLNDFIDGKGALSFPGAMQIVNPIIKLIENGGYMDIVYLCDNHNPNDKEFEKFPPHAIENTWGAEIIPELDPSEISEFAGIKIYIIEKQRYSGFYNTDLDVILENISPTEVDVVGVCTSICVMDTVGGLANRDYNVNIHKDMVADFDPEMHEFSLKRMENIYGAKII